MASRWVQAKQIKMQRMKRSHLKTYSAGYIPVGRTPNKQVFQMYLNSAKSGRHSVQEYVQAMLMVNAPRTEALARRLEVLAEVPLERNIILFKSKRKKIMLFFDESHSRFFIVECNRILGFIRKSIVYSSRNRALHVFNNNKIKWKDTVSLIGLEHANSQPALSPAE